MCLYLSVKLKRKANLFKALKRIGRKFSGENGVRHKRLKKISLNYRHPIKLLL